MTKYKIQRTKIFKKQYSKLLKQKDFKEDEFIKVLNLLANNKLLPIKNKNHLLEPKTNRNLGMPHTTRYIITIQKIR